MSWNRDGWRMWMVMVKPLDSDVFIPYQREDGSFAIHETRKQARQEVNEIWPRWGMGRGKRSCYVQMVGAYR